MNLKIVFICLSIIIVITSCGSCSPNPKGLFLWDIDFKNDPELSHYGMIFGENSAVFGDLLVCVRTGGYMFGIDKKTGEIMWTYQSSSNFQTTPLIIDNKIFNVSERGDLLLTILDLNGNSLHEEYLDGYKGNIVENIPSFYNNNIFYIVRKDDYSGRMVISIDIDDYSVNDILNFSGSHHSRIVYRDNVLYIPYESRPVSSDQSGIIAYDLLNEEEKWKTSFGELNGIINYNPIIHNDKLYVSVDGYVKELDLADGSILRTFEGQGFDGMSVGDDILFLPDWLYGYDLTTGELSWSQPVYASKDSGSVYHDGVFYFMAYGFSAIDAQSGKYLIEPTWDSGEGPSWEYDNQSGMPLLDDGVIYVNGLRGIYAFNTIGND